MNFVFPGDLRQRAQDDRAYDRVLTETAIAQKPQNQVEHHPVATPPHRAGLPGRAAGACGGDGTVCPAGMAC